MTDDEIQRSLAELHPASAGWALSCCRWDREEAEEVLQVTYLKILDGRALLEECAPTHEVRVHESAWSCAHGVGRWREDCGCSTGGHPDWKQAWRAPLRR